MSEDIELRSLRTFHIDTDAIEEYYDAKQDATSEFTLSPQLLDKVASDYDFFTHCDVKTSQKLSKKQKVKKRDNSNLMDLVKTELATVEAPIEENVITKIKFSTEPSYVEATPKLLQIFQRNDHSFTGARSSFSSTNLSPVFPRVLENGTMEIDEIPVEYMEPTNFDSLISNMVNSEQVKPKFLDIEIKNLKFKHHHNFSLEKLLVEKLILIYGEFETIKQSLKRVGKDIKVYRDTKDNLKLELTKITPKKEDIRFDNTVRKYVALMLELKNRQFELMKKEKEIVNVIVSLWSDVKMVREKSNKTKTPFELEIIQINIDKAKFQNERSLVFEQELNDLLEEVEYEFATKYIEYKESKLTNRATNSPKKKLTKPKILIDEESLREEAEKRANDLVRNHKIDIKVNNNDNASKDSVCYGKARNAYYHFKIYIDDVFVCESEHYFSKKDFNVEFLESFSVQILPENAVLNVVLNENSEEASEMKLKLSEIKKKSEFTKVEFTYNNITEPNAKHVGSGYNIKQIAAANKVRLKSSNVFDGHLYTKCEADIKATWNVKVNENYEENIKSIIELDKKIKRLLNGINNPTLDEIKDIIENIYELDISQNEEMMNTLSDICQSNIHTVDEFTVDENSPEFVRMKLLHLRNNGEFSNIKNKAVPLYASQISTEQLNCLQKSKEKDFDLNSFNTDKYTDTDPIELQRFIGTKYVEKLNENLLKNLNETLLKKTYKDVVCDFRDLSLRGIFSNQTSLANLATITNGARQNLSELLQKEQEIHINVLRAFNLPDRSPSVITDDDNVEDHEDSIAGYKVRSLRPFVKVSYQGCVAQTATAIGCHPTWNQTLKIVTKPGQLASIHINLYDEQKINVTENFTDDASLHSGTFHFRCFSKWLGSLEVPLYTVLALGKIRGTFKINMPSLLLGYETHKGEKETGRSLIPEVTQLLRKETSYITLQISTKTGLGFNHRYDLPTVNNTEDDYIIKHLNNFISEYQIDFPTRHISLTFIDTAGKNKCLTQFLQPLPLPDYEFFPKNPKRSESAVSKGSNQSKSSSSKSTDLKRNLDIEKGQDIEKESIYSSYEGRNWRKGDVSLEKLLNAALRYVSLIPCYEVKESHVVTLMGVELIRILYGSHLDHTLLLASYLLYLGLKTYIAIGLGLPRGPSSYVLAKYDLRSRRMVSLNAQVNGKAGFLSRNAGFLWYVYDAISGERFELRDVGCPLKTVDYVFDNENIWVNIQTAQDCESVSFDFSKTSDWQPVFDKNIFIMKHPMLSDTNLYSLPVDVDELRNALESRIKCKFQKWRSHMKTIWNRYCSTLLRDTLVQWEYWALNPAEGKPVFGQRMRQLMATYKVYGFPMNLPYTSTKAVISAVKSTSLHMNDDPKTEFGLGVEVYAYPNNVVSVWVFLASVTRI